MRALLIAFIITLAGTASADEERTLTAGELRHYAAAYHPAVRACYLEHGHRARRATGELSLRVIVHRDGYVHDVAITAPGVRGKALRRLDQCIRNEVLGWHFPIRRDFTTAILPYYFLYLDVPAAGPQRGCWNPKGCRPKPAKRPPARFPNV